MGSKGTLAVYTFAHFCVDFSCFYLLFALFSPQMPLALSVSVGFLLYDLIAFGLQFVIGFLCDIKKGLPAAPTGCALLLCGLALGAAGLPWAALATGALGNAFFHVGGGINSIAAANGKMARSGIFVASGALGVGLGTLCGKGGGPLWLPCLLCATSLLLCLWARGRRANKAPGAAAAARFHTASALPAGIVLLLCCLSIVVRGWGGGIIPAPWRTGPLLGLLPAVAACAGKAAGGFLADRFGARRTGVSTLLLSIPLLALGYGHPASFALGMFLFNVNMPITLCTIYSALPQNPGLSFGLTTLALLAGTVPLFFFALPAGAVSWAVLLSTGASALCLFLAAKNQGVPAKTKEEQP